MSKRNRYHAKKSDEFSAFKIGDCVAVKTGTRDPDYDIDIAGWQGRIVKIEDGEDGPLATILWDSLTLRQMPEDTLLRSEQDGLDWSLILLYVDELEPAHPRDKIWQAEEQAQEIIARLENEAPEADDELGEMGEAHG